MDYVEPELREDRGEVEAALEGELPELVELGDIRGDLHMHSNWSDGHATIEEVARAAKAMGYKYMAINDHSHSLGIAHGLTAERLLEQAEEIDEVNARVNGITVLKGTEADILSDGSVDFPDEVLERLDIVVASIHSGFQQSQDQITGRMISAIENPHVDIIGHPTGRLLGTRPAYDVDLERVMAAAADKRDGPRDQLPLRAARPQRRELAAGGRDGSKGGHQHRLPPRRPDVDDGTGSQDGEAGLADARERAQYSHSEGSSERARRALSSAAAGHLSTPHTLCRIDSCI